MVLLRKILSSGYFCLPRGVVCVNKEDIEHLCPGYVGLRAMVGASP